MKSNFSQRTLTGFLFVTAVTLSIVSHSISFMALLILLNALCLFEFYELILPDKSEFEKYLAISAGTLIYYMFALVFRGSLSLAWYYHIIPLFLLLFIVKLYENTHNEFITLAYQLLGLVYITLPLIMFTKMGYFNSFEYNAGLPMGFLILLWTSDTGAYLAGRSFGKRKLFERVSPKKTWEGSIGGLLATLLVSLLIAQFEWFDGVTLVDWLVIGLLIVAFGTYGDLFESLMKRNLVIKDSGTLLPGHGGILDRFDGLFLAVPAVFFYLLLTN
jgi:phosphatidate cytidylyltransferase